MRRPGATLTSSVAHCREIELKAFLSLVTADVMSTEWVHVTPDEPITTARRLFHVHEFNGLPVMDATAMCGWLTQHDLLRPFVFVEGESVPAIDDILARPVSSIMQHEPETVSGTDPLVRVLRRMVESGHRSYPVVDNERLVGVIARADLLRALDETLGWL